MTPRVASMVMTSRGIRLGIATIPRQRVEHHPDSELLQAALLEPRTAKPLTMTQRVIGAAVRWL